MDTHQPIERFEFDAPDLMAKHPPVFSNPNKELIFDSACPRGCVHEGRVAFTRWQRMPVSASPATNDIDVRSQSALRFEARPDVYDYRPVLADPGAMEWHVNFADPYVFSFYASDLMAQDEIQVAEHPAMAALREALVGKSVLLTEEDGEPTPILVSGVQRRVHFAFDRNVAEGRPDGLYGFRFQAAPPDVIARAVRAIEPPTVSNIIAIAAPRGGPGAYTPAELALILDTAYTGFRAAVLESARVRGRDVPVAIHSGFWGCGVFGGNRTVMIFLQVLAAMLAGASCVVMHGVDDAGARGAQATHHLLASLVRDGHVTAQALLARLWQLEFHWGVGDGN